MRMKLATGLLIAAVVFLASGSVYCPALAVEKQVSLDRSPVDCVLTPDERYLISANQTSGTLSVINLASKAVIHEVPCGEHTSALAISPNGKRLLASATFSHEVTAYDVSPEGKLNETRRVWLGFEPRGIVIDQNNEFAYVALSTGHTVAVLDLSTMKELARIPVGRWPRTLALTPNGKTLIAACSGDGSMTFVDVASRKVLRDEPFTGLNQGQIAVSHDSEFVYAPYIYHFGSGPTQRTIRLGWVTAARVIRLRVNTAKRQASLYLDTQGQAVSDPCGLAITPNEEWMACSASGTHEVLLFRNKELPFEGYNSRFLINEDLRKDTERYYRLALGGRPMHMTFSKDNRHLYVANYLLNSIQVVDIKDRKIAHTIDLGGPKELSLARQGEAIFYDGTRSFDQWYSCASCHYEGHSNGIPMDTTHDGRFGNPKMVPSLRYVTHTGPWTWHGWQKDLKAAMQKSMKESMLGKPLKEQEVEALIAYFGTLNGPKSPHLGAAGKMTESMLRGKAVYESDKAGCTSCHRGEYYTDSKVHIVGLEEPGDVYQGFNPPTLRGVYDRMYYLHDGRARTMEQLLTGPHSPERVTGNGKLSKEELNDLVEYLKGL